MLSSQFVLRLSPTYFLIIVFSAYAKILEAQKIDRWQLSASYGGIIAHSRDLVSISDSNPIGLSLSFDRMNLRPSSWQKCQCFSRSGLQLSYHNFQNRNTLGAATAISGYFEPVIYRRPKSELSIRNGVGISYLSKVYDPTTNPENVFFSAPISFLLFIQPTYSYYITDQWQINLSLAYNHISNGGQRQPNRGMNYPMATLGVSFSPTVETLPDFQTQKLDKTWYYALQAFGTMKTKEGDTNNRAAMIGMVAETSYRFGLLNSVGGGLELAHDASRLSEKTILAPFIAHHFIFGRFDFSQWMAFYVISTSSAPAQFYQRYLLLYELMPNLSIGTSLKAHGHVAENIDIRLQWKLK